MQRRKSRSFDAQGFPDVPRDDDPPVERSLTLFSLEGQPRNQEEDLEDLLRDGKSRRGSDNGDQLLTLSKFVSLFDYEWDQTDLIVYISVKLPGIEDHPSSKIETRFTERSLMVNLRDFQGSHKTFRVHQLAYDIVPEKSRFRSVEDEMYLVLCKRDTGHWDSLIHLPSVVRSEFELRFTEFFNSMDQTHGLHFIQIRDRGKFYAELVCDNGLEPAEVAKDLLVSIPSSMREVKDIIEFASQEIKTNMFQSGHYLLFAASILFDLKREFILKHPYCVRGGLEELNFLKVGGIRDHSDSLDERRAEKLKQEGDALFRNKQFLKAIQAYTKAIELAPHSGAYYLARSLAYKVVGNADASFNDDEKFIELDPFNAKGYLHHIAHWIDRGDLCKAEYFLNCAKQLDPQNPEIMDTVKKIKDLNLKSEEFITSLMKDYSFKKSLFFLKNITKHPDFLTPQLDRGIETCCRKNFVTEAKDFIQTLKLTMTEATQMKREAYFLYLDGIIAYYEGDEPRVHLNFSKSLRLEDFRDRRKKYEFMQRFFNLRQEGDNALSNHRLQEAIKCYSKCLKLEPDSIVSSRILLQMAEARRRQGRRKEARSSLSSAIFLKRDFSEAYAMRGECYLVDDRYVEAIKDLEKANQLSPCNRCQKLVRVAREKVPSPLAFSEASTISEEEIKMKEAALQKDLADVKNERGKLFHKSERYDEAIQAYSEAIGLHSIDPVYYANRSDCFMTLKNFKSALGDSMSALSLDPLCAKGYFRLAKCYLALGEAEEAIKALNEATTLKYDVDDLNKEWDNTRRLMELIDQANDFIFNNDFHNAEGKFAMATRLAEACVPLRLKRAKCLIQTEKFDDALSVCKEVLSLEENNSEALYFMEMFSEFKDKFTLV